MVNKYTKKEITMKKLGFLLLLSLSMLNGMEQQSEEPSESDQSTFEQWDQLPAELKYHLLSFVSTPGIFKDIANLAAATEEIRGLVQDQLFLDGFAKRTVKHDPERAKLLLKEAAAGNQVRVIQALIKADDSLKLYANELLQHIAGSSHDLADSKPTIMIKSLLEAGADANAEKIVGAPSLMRTALEDACKFGNSEIAKLLVQYGAHVNPRTRVDMRYESTPLREAVFQDNRDLVNFLIAHGADVTTWSGNSALWGACMLGKRDIAEELLNAGADVDTQEPALSNTPLLAAVDKGNKALVELFLIHNADMTIRNRNNITALDAARAALDLPVSQDRRNRQDIVNLLEDAQNRAVSGN
jgi:ankyrin repeat protein